MKVKCPFREEDGTACGGTATTGATMLGDCRMLGIACDCGQAMIEMNGSSLEMMFGEEEAERLWVDAWGNGNVS